MSDELHNRRLAQIVAALAGLRFGLAVWVLYYLRITDYAGIGIVEMLTLATGFLLEVPTGMVADRWGRKPSVIAGLATQALGYVILARATTLSTLAAALILLAIGRALFSGAFEALVHDGLPAADREHRFAALWGRIASLQLLSLSVATVAGGILYAVDPRWPFVGASIAFALAALTALGMREPRVPETAGPGLRTLTADLPVMLRGLLDLRLLLAVGVFFAALENVLDDVLAVVFGFGPIGLGVLWCCAHLAGAAGARGAAPLQRLLSSRRTVLLLALASAITLALAPLLGLWLGGLTILLRSAAMSCYGVVERTRVAAVPGAAQRATRLSLFEAMRNLPYVVGAYFLGTAMDAWGGRAVAASVGVAFLLALAIGAASLRRPASRAES